MQILIQQIVGTLTSCNEDCLEILKQFNNYQIAYTLKIMIFFFQSIEVYQNCRVLRWIVGKW